MRPGDGLNGILLGDSDVAMMKYHPNPLPVNGSSVSEYISIFN
jgi:hypothetical protein